MRSPCLLMQLSLLAVCRPWVLVPCRVASRMEARPCHVALAVMLSNDASEGAGVRRAIDGTGAIDVDAQISEIVKDELEALARLDTTEQDLRISHSKACVYFGMHYGPGWRQSWWMWWRSWLTPF